MYGDSPTLFCVSSFSLSLLFVIHSSPSPLFFLFLLSLLFFRSMSAEARTTQQPTVDQVINDPDVQWWPCKRLGLHVGCHISDFTATKFDHTKCFAVLDATNEAIDLVVGGWEFTDALRTYRHKVQVPHTYIQSRIDNKVEGRPFVVFSEIRRVQSKLFLGKYTLYEPSGITTHEDDGTTDVHFTLQPGHVAYTSHAFVMDLLDGTLQRKYGIEVDTLEGSPF